ncbi:ABC transporter ATP-binding protein [Muricoccus radiodurans]|uniref:ABC transporter ATP-binding protein n=1 Tax=Muricoccus radiodurans TaxID=2231721 RepID=UPI003CE82FD5
MGDSTQAHLVLDGLEKRFGAGPPAVEALSLQVRQGELLGMLGPSGCGKTTTLRMIGGLLPSSGGRILVAGKDITPLPPHRRDMGIVFQNYALFPHMTVAENLAFGLEMRGVPRAEITPRVRRALEMVRLPGFEDRRPRQLSGGQQQRVALARALIVEPSILLLDEPLSNLDANLREEMRVEIRDIQKRLGITAVFVTHDQAEALAICDSIALMHAGRLEQLGAPTDIYERPANAFVAGFVGRINRIRAQRAADGAVMLDGFRLGTSAGPAGPAVAMLRPHRIRLAAERDDRAHWTVVKAAVRRTIFVGDVLIIEAEVGGTILTVERHTLGDLPAPRPGETVELAWREDDLLVFPADATA